MAKKLVETLLADGWQGQVSGAFWRVDWGVEVDMEPSNYRERPPPANVWAFPNRQLIIDLDDASACESASDSDPHRYGRKPLNDRRF
jgi:hypothetical protein